MLTFTSLRKLLDAPVEKSDSDLTVYKIGKLDKDGKFVSRYMNFSYDKDALYKMEQPLKARYGGRGDGVHYYGVDEGFHAFVNEELATTFAKVYKDKSVICKFIIPKGSEVMYDNRKGYIVASQIMFLG